MLNQLELWAKLRKIFGIYRYFLGGIRTALGDILTGMAAGFPHRPESADESFAPKSSFAHARIIPP